MIPVPVDGEKQIVKEILKSKVMVIIDWLKNLCRGIKVAFQQFVVPFDISKYGKIGQHSVVKSNSSLVPRNM
jgi:hypothetical protein